MQKPFLFSWVAYFFIYSFIGWCFESAFVSIKQQKWINRGFLKGAFLPIYGSGAVFILLATMPVYDNPILVFVVGMLAATVLEYITGVIMENLFKVRYWDYTNKPFNLHGYICLTSSLAWGGFSLLLVYVIHKPVERLIEWINLYALGIALAILLVILAKDVVQSFKTAMALRADLDQTQTIKAELQSIRNRLMDLEKVMAQAKNVLDEQIKEKKALLEKKLTEENKINDFYHKLTREKVKLLKRNPTARSKRYSESLEMLKNRLHKK